MAGRPPDARTAAAIASGSMRATPEIGRSRFIPRVAHTKSAIADGAGALAFAPCQGVASSSAPLHSHPRIVWAKSVPGPSVSGIAYNSADEATQNTSNRVLARPREGHLRRSRVRVRLCAHRGAPPSPTPAERAVALSPAEMAIEHQPICVGSSVVVAGSIADTLYYRAAVLPSGQIAVGYFVFYSEERPWGKNWMTWTVLPALGVDMFYSRSLLVGPGVQRALYGKGDVEGFRIVYDVEHDGALRVDSAVADDGKEGPVVLDRAHVLAFDAKRPTFYTDVWSHQLGGRGVQSREDLASIHCYEADRIRALSDDIAREFRLERRADPAHVELLGGVSIHDATQQSAGHEVSAVDIQG